MALALREAAGLRPDIRLAQAVSEFEATLTSEQKARFKAWRTSATSAAPTMSDVMRLTAEMDLETTRKHGRVRSFGPRMTNLLQAIQQFAALGDVVVGGSQNLIACGVWTVARMTVHAISRYLSYLDKLSVIFMAVGRNAPRYQAMAEIYLRSKNLRRYLCEYFIVVTRLCHQSLKWCQKSALSRLSTSISDPDLKGFQAELDVWSTSIKEEVDLLMNQKVDEESKENAKFRLLSTSLFEKSSHQRRIKRCARFLQACSQYDHRTIWKQTRKSGTTRLMESLFQYQQWKFSQSKHASILVRGKLGAGKSVLLANMVDDLILQSNTIVLYYFARYDIPQSLDVRTILGCLLKQLLEHFVADTNFDPIFTMTATHMDLDDIMSIFEQLPSHGQRVFMIVDGIDECSSEAQEILLTALTTIHARGYKICISARTPEDASIWENCPFGYIVSIPDDNPDISEYIRFEVARRIQNGSLCIRDHALIRDVEKQLIDGACGMFLWASLQLDSICTEISDQAIREAIENLPQGLTETFERNLIKANPKTSKSSKQHYIRLFKFLVAARELLTTEQLREAVSVVTGQTTWNPTTQIYSLHAVLKFCGSLVMVDEEDDTVRFIHHSARSFCIERLPRYDIHPASGMSDPWNFTEDEANRAMAEMLVTYLSYNVFDTRLSTNVIPKIEANSIPRTVALSAIRSSPVGKGLASKILRMRSNMRHDVGPILAEASTSRTKEGSQQFLLLSYAVQNWIEHTSHLSYIDSSCRWSHLIDHPVFGIKPNNRLRELFIRPETILPVLCPLPTRYIIWAFSQGHVLLLKNKLKWGRGVQALRACVKLWALLRYIMPTFIMSHMHYRVVKWLCGMLFRLQIDHPAKKPLLSRLFVSDELFEEILTTAIEISDDEAISLLLARPQESFEMSQVREMVLRLSVSESESGKLSPRSLLVLQEFIRDTKRTRNRRPFRA